MAKLVSMAGTPITSEEPDGKISLSLAVLAVADPTTGTLQVNHGVITQPVMERVDAGLVIAVLGELHKFYAQQMSAARMAQQKIQESRED